MRAFWSETADGQHTTGGVGLRCPRGKHRLRINRSDIVPRNSLTYLDIHIASKNQNISSIAAFYVYECTVVFACEPSCLVRDSEMAQWLERKFTDRKIRGSNPTFACQLPLSSLGQPGSIPALVLPSGGAAVRHRKGVTAERSFCSVLFRPKPNIVDGVIERPVVRIQRRYLRCPCLGLGNLVVPSCRSTKGHYGSRGAAKLSKPIQEQSKCWGWVRTTGLLISNFEPYSFSYLKDDQKSSGLTTLTSSISSVNQAPGEQNFWSALPQRREFTDQKTRGSNPTPFCLHCPCLGLSTLSVPQPSCILRVAWQLGTGRVLQLSDSYYLQLRHLWRQSGESSSFKGRVYQATVRVVLLCGCEAWPVRAAELRRLQAFDNRCLRTTARVGWCRRIRDETIRKRVFGCTTDLSIEDCVQHQILH
ncbi:hypothetical protein CSKR_110027 [Clonorchis sinensis]|uniref:Uncharacterized protein n=1 Tax=Clonorchis sinensis TaxID=79923 RepID=A0A3R7GHS0_CLOSI|nr:hypothetical protein CSKR_110027 [Clonorchis sinensis]